LSEQRWGNGMHTQVCFVHYAKLTSDHSRKRTQSGEVIHFTRLDPWYLRKLGSCSAILPLLETPSGQCKVKVLVARRAAMVLRLLLSGYLGKQYSLISLTHIDLSNLALPTNDLRKLITKTTQLNRESQKSNAGRICSQNYFLHDIFYYSM
jgi:hypothetical protein